MTGALRNKKMARGHPVPIKIKPTHSTYTYLGQTTPYTPYILKDDTRLALASCPSRLLCLQSLNVIGQNFGGGGGGQLRIK